MTYISASGQASTRARTVAWVIVAGAVWFGLRKVPPQYRIAGLVIGPLAHEALDAPLATWLAEQGL